MLAAVGQMCSTSNLALNARLCTSIIRRAAAASARIILLPEACDFLGVPPDETHKYSQSLDDSEFVKAVKGQAIDSQIWVGVGVHEKAEEDPKKCYNVHLLISPQGQIVQRYKKIHLFDAKHSGKSILESNTTLPGKELMDPVETPVGKLGLLTCYDLRFPEVALSLRRRGAQLIAYPSAFTLRTGPPHWEVLLRARAIETQCYVLAPAQIGQHSETRTSYGHALIVDPWGQVIAQAPDRPPTYPPDEQDEDAGTFVTAEIELPWLEQLREEMPLWEQRKSWSDGVYPIL